MLYQTMTVNFRSIFDVTYSEWLEGLGIIEAEIPDAVILEGSWWREDRQKDRLSYLEGQLRSAQISSARLSSAQRGEDKRS